MSAGSASRFIRGEGRYLDDLTPPGVAHVAFVRSRAAHARIRAVKLAPGAGEGVALYDGGWFAGRARALRLDGPGLTGVDSPCVADGVARWAGQPVAAVLAATAAEADDAARDAEIDDDELPHVGDLDAAEAAANLVHPDILGNVLFRRRVNAGATDAAFAAPDRVVLRGRYRFPRQAAMPIECRGVIAVPTPDGGVEVHISTQIPHLARTAIARVLGLEERHVRVLRPDVGGGFGVKAHVLGDELAVAVLAHHLGRPMKWVEGRREHVVAAAHAHDHDVEIALAADRDGRIVAGRGRVRVDVGADSIWPLSASLEPMTCAQSLFAPYRLEALEYEALGFATNKTPVGAYRGVGLTPAVFATERLVDRLAATLDLDPAELRRRNLLGGADFPYTTAAGRYYESGDYEAVLAAALEAAGYAELRAAQAGARGEARAFGVGLAAFNEHTAPGSAEYRARGIDVLPGFDAARVRVDAEGSVEVFLSSGSTGQDYERVFAHLAARELGVHVARVRVTEGDTDLCPPGTGTFVSRGAAVLGAATRLACEAVRLKMARLAATLLGAEDVQAAEGWFASRADPARRIPFSGVAEAAYLRFPGATLPDGMQPGLDETRFYDPPHQVFGASAHVCAVEIDRATGELHVVRYAVAEDAGTVVDREALDGQLLGAIAQGIGGARFEQLTYEDGQLQTTGFLDYLVPTARDVPNVRLAHLSTPSSFPGGAKGAGESGTVGVPAALANAVADALGVDVVELPLTCERIWALANTTGGTS